MRSLAALTLLSLAACGIDPLCQRLNSSGNRFFTASTALGDGGLGLGICQSPDGGPRITQWGARSIRSNNCNMGIGTCTPTERATITTYVQCLENAPVCSSGNEASAANAVDACVKTLLNTGISEQCMVTLD